jgi:chaperone required for assembly of F1-ATPase
MRELFDEVAGQSPLDPHEAVRQSTRTPQRERFYADVSVEKAAEGWRVLLDGKPVRTPSRKLLAAPEHEIATIIAAEWQAQVEVLDPMTMPMTRLANSIVQSVAGNEMAIADDIAKYFGTDLICYRAAHPSELIDREAAAWDGVLYWAAETFGARFVLAQGIVHAEQPSTALAAARAALPATPWPLAACHVVTTLTGSALLALALAHGARNADEVWAAAHVDEDWNIERWGVDEEVAARRAARRRDFDAAVAVIAAMRRA